jgi:hypothetical protein
MDTQNNEEKQINKDEYENFSVDVSEKKEVENASGDTLESENQNDIENKESSLTGIQENNE